MVERWGASPVHASQKPAINRAEIERGIYGISVDGDMGTPP